METEASLPNVNMPIRLCYACIYFHSWVIGRGHIIYQKYPTIIMKIELTITSGISSSPVIDNIIPKDSFS